MRKQSSKEENSPQLLGEDFDVFPDMGEHTAPATNAAPEPEANDAPEEDPGPTELQQKVANIPEDKWKRYQLLGGIVLGMLCGVLITFGNTLFPGSTGIILAFGLAVVLPNILERQLARTVRRLRLSMAATIAVWLVASLLYGVLNPGAVLVQ